MHLLFCRYADPFGLEEPDNAEELCTADDPQV
jgi:hypothetical protein